MQFAGSLYEIWSITGSEAKEFLHNILTADIKNLEDGEASYACLLTPQGKILFGGMIYHGGAGQFYLIQPKQTAEAFIKRLKLYILRSDVNLTKDEGKKISIFDNNSQEISFHDPRPMIDLFWYIGEEEAGMEIEDYHKIRCEACTPEFALDYDTNSYFPHDVGLDLQKGVSFKKGCYIGQEVVSRMYHKTDIRKRPHLFFTQEAIQSYELGDQITLNEKPIADILRSESIGSKNIILTICRRDRLEELEKTANTLLANQTTVTPQDLS